jgi:hypothetical protein
MWPFRRKPATREIDLGRDGLRESQREHTLQYGWEKAEPTAEPEVLRESLERNEEGLPQRDERPG